MPIYEYKCKKCNKEFELLVSASNREAKARCPHCGSRRTERLISGFATSSKEVRTVGKNCGSCTASDCSSCK